MRSDLPITRRSTLLHVGYKVLSLLDASLELGDGSLQETRLEVRQTAQTQHLLCASLAQQHRRREVLRLSHV